MPSSTQTVLGMPELFENILLHVHLRTLLTAAQLVNREWRATIVNSPALQRALFFQPWPAIPSPSPSTGVGKEQQPCPKPKINPLLAEAFPMFFDKCCFGRRKSELASFAHNSAAGYGDALLQVGASWRRMLICQPPVMRLGIWHRYRPQRGPRLPNRDCPGSFTCRAFSLQEEERPAWPELGLLPGLRMGTLYDRVIDMLVGGRCSVALYWDIERDFAPREGREEEEGLFSDEPSWWSEDYVNVDNGKDDSDDWDDHPETIQLLYNAVRTVDAVIMVDFPATCLVGYSPPGGELFKKRYKFPAMKAEV